MQINFTGSIKIQGSALMKLAKLNNASLSSDAQKAYDELKTAASTLAEDLLIETSDKGGVIVSKLLPLQKDTVEITRNSDFIKGLKQAIQIIETENTSQSPTLSYSTDLHRLRIIGQIKN